MSNSLNRFLDHPVVSVTTSATKLLSSAAVIAARGRRGVFIQPEGTVYIGGPSVTSSTGIKLVTDQILFVECQQGQEIHAIAAGATNVRVLPAF